MQRLSIVGLEFLVPRFRQALLQNVTGGGVVGDDPRRPLQLDPVPVVENLRPGGGGAKDASRPKERRPEEDGGVVPDLVIRSVAAAPSGHGALSYRCGRADEIGLLAIITERRASRNPGGSAGWEGGFRVGNGEDLARGVIRTWRIPEAIGRGELIGSGRLLFFD